MSTNSNCDSEGQSPEFKRGYALFSSAFEREILPDATEYPPISQSEFAEALELFNICAEREEGAAMYYISMYYQCALPPCSADFDLFFEWTRKSYESGFVFAGNNLYPMYAAPGSKFYNPELAVGVMDAMKQAGCKHVPE